MLNLRFITVPSSTRANVKHTVAIADWAPVSCTCEGWQFGIRKAQPYVCKHMRELWKVQPHKGH